MLCLITNSLQPLWAKQEHSPALIEKGDSGAALSELTLSQTPVLPWRGQGVVIVSIQARL